MSKKTLSVILLFLLPFLAIAQNRKALVISNYDYPSKPIKSGAQDGNSIAKLLSRKNFKVTKGDNLNQLTFSNAISDFAAVAEENDSLLLYYRGYAAQTNGKNYLLPAKTAIFSQSDIPKYALSLDAVISTLKYSAAKQVFLFLDCCDENPWQRLDPKARDGLAYTRLPEDKEFFMMFAQNLYKNSIPTENGESLFTKYFIEEFTKANDDITKVCAKITADVQWYSGDEQIPWINSSEMTQLVITNPLDFLYNSEKASSRPNATKQIASSETQLGQETDGLTELTGGDASMDFSLPEGLRKMMEGRASEGENATVVSETSDAYIKLPSFRLLGKKNRIHPFEIAFFGINYSVYLEIRNWAKAQDYGENSYNFKRILSEDEYTTLQFDKVKTGVKIKDITTLDALAWVNALNEYMGSPPIYYEVPSNTVFRDASKEDAMIVAYLNQEGYRFPLKAELQYTLQEKFINSHYKGYLLAMSAPDLSTYKAPSIKVKTEVPIGKKILAASLNPFFGIGSYIEGDIPSGVLFTTTQTLGVAAVGAGIFYGMELQKSASETPEDTAKNSWLVPNIIIGSGIGVYGVSALLGIIMPFIHSPMKKQTFYLPSPSGSETKVQFEVSPEIAPNGDLAMGLTFKW